MSDFTEKLVSITNLKDLAHKPPKKYFLLDYARLTSPSIVLFRKAGKFHGNKVLNGHKKYQFGLCYGHT